jgi:tetratricopeptide (TPR) repeat protein
METPSAELDIAVDPALRGASKGGKASAESDSYRGDWAGAQRAYAAAVGLASDLPAARYSWGQALARHGLLSAAQAKFAPANQRGPHWADPLKAWGDALAAQGRWKEARAKYDQALAYAPVWRALRAARALALAKTKDA